MALPAARFAAEGFSDEPHVSARGPRTIGPRPAWAMENLEVEYTPQLQMPAQNDGLCAASVNADADTSSIEPRWNEKIIDEPIVDTQSDLHPGFYLFRFARTVC